VRPLISADDMYSKYVDFLDDTKNNRSYIYQLNQQIDRFLAATCFSIVCQKEEALIANDYGYRISNQQC
jgi:hypothetical protein